MNSLNDIDFCLFSCVNVLGGWICNTISVELNLSPAAEFNGYALFGQGQNAPGIMFDPDGVRSENVEQS